MKQDIKDFVSQKLRSKYYTVSKLSGFLDAQNTYLCIRIYFKKNGAKSCSDYSHVSSLLSKTNEVVNSPLVSNRNCDQKYFRI
jgi:hypothetical protein